MIKLTVPVDVKIKYVVSSPRSVPRKKFTRTIVELEIVPEITRAINTWTWQQILEM